MALTQLDDRRALRRQALLDALGHPERKFPVVQVGGTNGKGSTAAMVASGLRAAGYHVGRFTSPDLSGPHERFWCAGRTMEAGELEELEAELTPIIDKVAAQFADLPTPGRFERWTLMAWVWFAALRVDVAVIEVGVGGRTDATNVFDRPILTAIASVSLDHAATLGPDVASVAREKAGIFRTGVRVVTTAQGEALAVLKREAERLDAPLTAVSPLVGVAEGEGWLVHLPQGGKAHLPLAGAFQLENAGLAVAALAALEVQGWHLGAEAYRRGLSEVVWPGRLETWADPAGGSWLLDGAHNPAAVAALVQDWGHPEVVVVGIQRTKEAVEMIPLLTADRVPLVVVPVPGAETSWEAVMLSEWAQGPVLTADSVDIALAQARHVAPDGLRCVTGSLYLVGAVRSRLMQGAS